MRKIVLQSGSAHAGQWMSEARDVAADFRETFGFDAPAVTGIAVGNDTDNTDESVTTWFGDISFRP
jgi:pyruvate/2-oxoacid:ferredoxin oxidoreductase beta subunit